MTRKEAIGAIKSNRPTSGYTMLCEALDMAVAALREQQRWIPVTERMPDESGNYLVMVDGICMILHYSARHKAFNSFDSLNARESGELSMDCTHWMPMPEPPKEDS